MHTVTRDGVVRARTAAINELKALVLTSPDGLRSELRGLTTTALIKRCAAFRTTSSRPIAEQCVRNTMRASLLAASSTSMTRSRSTTQR